MKPVSRDIIVDLLPLYIAGEVSPATRQAVDEFLATDHPRVRQFLERKPDPAPRGTVDGFAAAFLRRIHYEH